MEIVDYVNILNEKGRYKALYKMFGLDVIVAVQQDSHNEYVSLGFTLIKDNYHETKVWTYTVLNSMDEDSVIYCFDSTITNMISDISQRIIDETQI